MNTVMSAYRVCAAWAVTCAVALSAGLLAGCAAEERAAPVSTASTASTDPWVWKMPDCVGYDPADYDASAYRVAVTVDGARTVERYRPGWAEQAMAEIREVVVACGSYEHGGYHDPKAYLGQNAVVDSGFAGDGALLIRTTRLAPPEPVRVTYAAVVRRGDAVTTICGEDRAAVRCAAVTGDPLTACGAGDL